MGCWTCNRPGLIKRLHLGMDLRFLNAFLPAEKARLMSSVENVELQTEVWKPERGHWMCPQKKGKKEKKKS